MFTSTASVVPDQRSISSERPFRRAARWLGVGAMLASLIAAPAFAATFTVTNTADSGAGSLRQAMLNANAIQVTGGTACASHTIVFAIPGSGPHTIRPLSPLPVFNIPMTLDGYSQPGALENNLLDGDNAVLKIEIDGSLAGSTDGFYMPRRLTTLCTGSGSFIRGLVINRFAGAAIAIGGGGTCPPGNICQVGNIIIRGNFIGTDVTGLFARGNASAALRFGSGSVHVVVGDEDGTVGGPQNLQPQSRNIISGNAGDGIAMSSDSALQDDLSTSHVIRSNYIGLAANGTSAVPNGGRGVTVGFNATTVKMYDNLISGNGGDGVGILDSVRPGTWVIRNGIGIGVGAVPIGNSSNGVLVSGAATGVFVGAKYVTAPYPKPSIANNGGAGVFVDDVAQVDVNAAIGGNAGLAVDLAPIGVTPNDPGDGDIGPNELLNKPVIASAVIDAATNVATITGSLDAAPNSTYEIDLYTSASCDSSGYGGGEVFLALSPAPSIITVTTDSAGNASFSRQAAFLTANRVLTALTRRQSTLPGSNAFIVSEFSNCKQIVSSADLIFRNGFDS